MPSRLRLGLERDDPQTGWLVRAWILWLGPTASTIMDTWVVVQSEQGDPYGRASFLAIMIVLSLMFGFFSYRASLRVMRGPGRQVTKPYLRYIGTSVLAMFLAWWIHVFGMVCGLFHTPFQLVLLAFFVPTWLLLAMNIPTRAKLARWANAEDRAGHPTGAEQRV